MPKLFTALPKLPVPSASQLLCYHGKAVQLIDEVNFGGVKYMEMSREGNVELSCDGAEEGDICQD